MTQNGVPAHKSYYKRSLICVQTLGIEITFASYPLAHTFPP